MNKKGQIFPVVPFSHLAIRPPLHGEKFCPQDPALPTKIKIAPNPFLAAQAPQIFYIID